MCWAPLEIPVSLKASEPDPAVCLINTSPSEPAGASRLACTPLLQKSAQPLETRHMSYRPLLIGCRVRASDIALFCLAAFFPAPVSGDAHYPQTDEDIANKATVHTDLIPS